MAGAVVLGRVGLLEAHLLVIVLPMMDRDDPDEGGMDEKESFSCALAPPLQRHAEKGCSFPFAIEPIIVDRQQRRST
jgi:hypothetical protein